MLQWTNILKVIKKVYTRKNNYIKKKKINKRENLQKKKFKNIFIETYFNKYIDKIWIEYKLETKN